MRATRITIESSRDFACFNPETCKFAFVSMVWLRMFARAHSVNSEPDMSEWELKKIVENFVPECIDGVPDMSPLRRHFPHTETWWSFTSTGARKVVRRYAYVKTEFGVLAMECPCTPTVEHVSEFMNFASIPDEWKECAQQGGAK